MRPPRLAEVGLVTAGFTASVILTWGDPWIDLFFAGVLLSSLLLLARHVGSGVLRSRQARRHEQDVAAIDRDEAVRDAVEQERARLSAEIDRSVRRSLLAVGRLVPRAEAALATGADPRPELLAIQAESRAAMAELRRQLGLIGSGSRAAGVLPTPPVAEAVQGKSDRLRTINRGDVILTLTVLVLSVTEALAYAEPGSAWWTTGIMALTVLPRRLMPVATVLAGAAVLLLGAMLDAAVTDGFSFPIIVGLLLWSVLEVRPGMASMASAAGLYTAAIGSRFAHEPENGPINVLVLGIVAVCALIVGHSRRVRERADEGAGAHEAELTSARERATERTRQAMARELHDVASHAVSLVAVQAGAAELAWPQDPAATRAGVQAVGDTVSTALGELDVQSWGTGSAPAWDDIERIVARLQGAGLDIRLTASGRPPDVLLPVVHRLVQEALTNVLKHADGATAYVTIGSDEQCTHLEVTDDGPGRTVAVAGFGLAGLEDRVTAVGGRLLVGPGDGGGFALRAVLPHEPTQLRGRARP
ncbi:histidine kinase [Pseudactinotalea sp. Z1732]|uniref:sensor histidine kinase n=1 Tax=Micrococcales TaxID=85006 RepID=UPI003C7B82B1